MLQYQPRPWTFCLPIRYYRWNLASLLAPGTHGPLFYSQFLFYLLPTEPQWGRGQTWGFLISSRSHFSSGGSSGWDGSWMIVPFCSTPLSLWFILILTGLARVSKIYVAGPILVYLDLPLIPNFLLLLGPAPKPDLSFSLFWSPWGSATARVLGLSLSTSPHSSLSLNASIYTSASNVELPVRGMPVLLGLLFHPNPLLASLSPCRSLNNFLTASMAVRSLAYCQVRADFSSVQVIAGFSLYNPPTYLETGPAADSYARRTISWSDKPYMTCFFWMDCIHSCSSVGSPLNEGNLMPPISPRNPFVIFFLVDCDVLTRDTHSNTLLFLPSL